jgi:hypothetical protein
VHKTHSYANLKCLVLQNPTQQFMFIFDVSVVDCLLCVHTLMTANGTESTKQNISIRGQQPLCTRTTLRQRHCFDVFLNKELKWLRDTDDT